MERFSKTYIEKCIKYKDDIYDKISMARGQKFPQEMGPSGIVPEIPQYFFKKGDYIHCPNRMNDFEVKEVKEMSQNHLSTGPLEDYPIEKCVLIPTEEQLARGLEDSGFNVKGVARDKGPEGLLDIYINISNRVNK